MLIILFDFLLSFSYNNKKGGEIVVKGKIYYGLLAVVASVVAFFFLGGLIGGDVKRDAVAKADTTNYTITFDTSDWEDITSITLWNGTAFVEQTSTANIIYSYTDGDPSQKVWLYSLTKSGYQFAGWLASIYESAKYDSEVGAYYIDSDLKKDLTLYADFDAVEYNITYSYYYVDDEDHSIPLYDVTNENPNKYTTDKGLELRRPSKTGFTFLGWYTEAEFINPIESILKGTIGDFSLFAKFEVKECVLSYAYGGYEDIHLKYGNVVTQEMLPTPIREGFEFEGWYTEAGFITQVEAGYEIEDNVMLYPKWKKIENPIWKPLTFGGMGLVLILTGVWFLIFRKNKNDIS